MTPDPCAMTVFRGKRRARALFMVPAGTDACRLRVDFRMESPIWKTRLLGMIGLKGRTLVAKSPLLCKLLWPDELRTMRVSRHWSQTEVEVALPPRGATAVRVHNEAMHRMSGKQVCLRLGRFCMPLIGDLGR